MVPTGHLAPLRAHFPSKAAGRPEDGFGAWGFCLESTLPTPKGIWGLLECAPPPPSLPPLCPGLPLGGPGSGKVAAASTPSCTPVGATSGSQAQCTRSDLLVSTCSLRKPRCDGTATPFMFSLLISYLAFIKIPRF